MNGLERRGADDSSNMQGKPLVKRKAKDQDCRRKARGFREVIARLLRESGAPGLNSALIAGW
jgi:hypothetical protein